MSQLSARAIGERETHYFGSGEGFPATIAVRKDDGVKWLRLCGVTGESRGKCATIFCSLEAGDSLPSVLCEIYRNKLSRRP